MVQGSNVNPAILQGIILVYDITDEKSFENIQNWMKSIKEVRILPHRWGNWVEPGGWRGLWGWAGPNLPFYSQNASAGVERLLLGNKCDMEAKRKVQKEQADKVRTRSGNVRELGWEGQGEVGLQTTWQLPFIQLTSSHFTPDSWLGSMESDFSRLVPNPVWMWMR